MGAFQKLDKKFRKLRKEKEKVVRGIIKEARQAMKETKSILKCARMTPEPMSDEMLNQLESLPEELCGPHELNRAVTEIRRLREVTKLQGYSIRLHGQDCRQQQRVIEELKEDETEMLRKLSAANAQLREWKILIAELEARVAQLTINREGLLPAWQKQRESLRGRIAHLEAELSNERIDSQKWRDYCETKRD